MANIIKIIRSGEEKVSVEVPRFYDKENDRREESAYYRKLHEVPMPTEEVLKGLSLHDYIEKKMRRVNCFEKLHLLRTALSAELKFER